MVFTDTHTHLYLDAFNNDRNEVIQKAIQAGVHYHLLPNINTASIEPMLEVCKTYPENCFPMIGLHPTSVHENYQQEITAIEEAIDRHNFAAIGEIGIDLYWDKKFFNEQKKIFKFQLELALDLNLPVAIHTRESMEETLEILMLPAYKELKGVLHCFSGSIEQAKKAIDLGFCLGVGGVITFKNSGLKQVIHKIPLRSILLETDAPYLAPVPFRGSRNEGSYIPVIASHLADVYQTDREQIARITTENAFSLFHLKQH
ncbi:MAG: TatD family hydrolase [Bacteroidales bacterium]|nr:TatD family hydrolase [Bacteroidales bacterium]